MTAVVPPLESIKRVAILRLSALGDVCMVVPVVRTLQKAMPHAHITWFISRPAYDLVEGLDGVDFIVIDKPRRIRDYLALWWRVRRHRFDVLLCMQAALRANLIYPLLRAKCKIGFDKIRARDGQQLFTNQQIEFNHPNHREHIMDSFLGFTRAMGINAPVIEWQLSITDIERTWVKSKLPSGNGHLIVINPMASKAERTWSAERYAEVIDRIYQRGCRIVFSGGNSEEEQNFINEIKIKTTDDVTDLCGQTSPKQLAALIEMADCVIAPDTGPVHMAVAVGTPVVGLYAVAPTWLSGPYLGREHCVDHYNDAVEQILKKDPATVPWGTRVHDNRAMLLISVHEVVSRVLAILEGEQRGKAEFTARDVGDS